MNANYLILAAAAWQGYQEAGRGAIMVDVDGEIEWMKNSVGATGGTRFAFISEGERDGRSPFWPNAEVEHKVRTYDPARQVVVIFLHGGTVTSYTLSKPSLPPPPAAFQRIGRKGNST